MMYLPSSTKKYASTIFTSGNLSISLGRNRPDEDCYTLCELLQPLIDVEVDEVDIQNCIHHLENGVDFIPNKQALSLSLIHI